jgi:large subunit ribosomal protein L21
MKYAVIKLAGKQYKVSENEKVLVDKLDEATSPKVLLLKDDEKVLIGKPYLDKVQVSYKKEEIVKGKKIDVFKYKGKSRYRKHTGFRAQYSPIVIEKISS